MKKSALPLALVFSLVATHWAAGETKVEQQKDGTVKVLTSVYNAHFDAAGNLDEFTVKGEPFATQQFNLKLATPGQIGDEKVSIVVSGNSVRVQSTVNAGSWTHWTFDENTVAVESAGYNFEFHMDPLVPKVILSLPNETDVFVELGEKLRQGGQVRGVVLGNGLAVTESSGEAPYFHQHNLRLVPVPYIIGGHIEDTISFTLSVGEPAPELTTYDPDTAKPQ